MAISASDLPDNPFVAGPMITDPRLFVGRGRELARLFNLMQQPVSANVTGERRIGKSCLLYRTLCSASRKNPHRFAALGNAYQDRECSP